MTGINARSSNNSDKSQNNKTPNTPQETSVGLSDPRSVVSQKKKKVPTWLWISVIVLTILVTVTTILTAYLVITVYFTCDDDIPGNIEPEPGIHYEGYSEPRAAKEPFSFDDIFSADFRAKSFSASWLPDTNVMVYKDSNGNLVKYDCDTEKAEELVSADIMADYSVYFTNADASYILLGFNYIKRWRHSFSAKYNILNVGSGNVEPLCPSTDCEEAVQLDYAGWAPVGDALVFVQNGNVYYQDSVDGDINIFPLTSDGNSRDLFHGIPDWLYEEDVLSSREATYWSPDGGHLIYATFDDKEVPLVRYPLYNSASDVYSEQYNLAYPKAGDKQADGSPGHNTKVTLTVYNTTTEASMVISPPDALKDVDHYYTRVAWRDENHVMITWTNRVQNHAIISMCDVLENQCIQHMESQISDGWIDSPWPKPMTPSGVQDIYYTILSHNVSDNGNVNQWKQLAKVTMPTDAAGEVEFLTESQEDISTIVAAFHNNLNMVYAYSSRGKQTDRHLISVNYQTKEMQCLTCEITDCEYVTASFSDLSDYYILGCLGPDVPTYHLYKTSDNQKIRTLEDNADLKTRLGLKAIPRRQFESILIHNGQHTGSAEIFFPEDLKDDETRPLLVYAYAGPGSQRVTKRWPMGTSISNWLTYMKSTHRVIVASLDGRGSSGREDENRFEMYKKLGTVEVDDQQTFALYLKSLISVNSEADIAAFGWSYGGQTSSHLMGRPNSQYKCGIAVAPVTTKRYYDTAYTERYMGLDTPEDNEAGYNDTDVLNKVEYFRDKKYLIAHGTHDDNVHFRHAAMMIKELSEAEIQFHQYMYVDQDHSITDPKQSRHLFRALTNFLLNDCWTDDQLNPPEPTPPESGSTMNVPSYLIAILCLVTFKLLTTAK